MVLVPTITCPVCSGPLDVGEGVAACAVGHEFDDRSLLSEVEAKAARALWAAVRALEDQVATARWWADREGAATPDRVNEVAEHARTLRELLLRRADPDAAAS